MLFMGLGFDRNMDLDIGMYILLLFLLVTC